MAFTTSFSRYTQNTSSRLCNGCILLAKCCNYNRTAMGKSGKVRDVPVASLGLPWEAAEGSLSPERHGPPVGPDDFRCPGLSLSSGTTGRSNLRRRNEGFVPEGCVIWKVIKIPRDFCWDVGQIPTTGRRDLQVNFQRENSSNPMLGI